MFHISLVVPKQKTYLTVMSGYCTSSPSQFHTLWCCLRGVKSIFCWVLSGGVSVVLFSSSSSGKGRNENSRTRYTWIKDKSNWKKKPIYLWLKQYFHGNNISKMLRITTYNSLELRMVSQYDNDKTLWKTGKLSLTDWHRRNDWKVTRKTPSWWGFEVK